MFYRSLPIVFALSACATPPLRPVDDGELGLVDLRRELNLFPVAGRVEHRQDGDWIMYRELERDTPLMRLRPIAADAICGHRDAFETAVAFEGAPGVVITGSKEDLLLWQVDPKRNCVVATPIFNPPARPPAGKPIAKYDQAKDKQPVQVRVPSPGDPQGVLVTLGPAVVQVSMADGSVTEYSFPDAGKRCGFSVELAADTYPDGTVMLEVQHVAITAIASDNGECDDAYKDYSPEEYQATGHVAIQLAKLGPPRIIETDFVPPTFGEDTGGYSRVFELPDGGTLIKQYTLSQSRGRESNDTSFEWNWTFVPGAGAPEVVLAAGVTSE